jgi:hypothetical protein
MPARLVFRLVRLLIGFGLAVVSRLVRVVVISVSSSLAVDRVVVLVIGRSDACESI